MLSVVICFSILILADFIFGFDWDIEEFFIEKPNAFGQVLMGRMSPLTALLFVLESTAILLFNYRDRKSVRYFFGTILLISFFLSTILLIGYLYDTPLLYGGSIIPVALPTAICFFLLVNSIILYINYWFWPFSILLGNSTSVKLTVSFLPAVAFLIILNNYLITVVFSTFQNPAFISAIVLIVATILVGIVVLVISRSLGASLERAEAEISSAKALAEKNERKFKLLTDKSPLAIYVSTGVEQVATYVNSTFTELFGYTIDDVPTVSDWWPIAYPNKQYREEIVLEWQNKVKKAIDTQTEIEPIEVEVTCKDGSLKNIRWGYVSTENHNWAFGQDITNQKIAEKQSYRYNKIFEKSLNEIYLFNTQDLRFVQVNDAAIKNLGYTLQEMKELTPLSIKPEYDKVSFLKMIKPLLNKEKKIEVFETVHQRKDKSRYSVEVYLQLMEFDNELVFVAIIIDITERRRMAKDLLLAKEKAEESDRLKSAFLANMSHEIRTPMNGIMGFTDLLKEPDLSGDQQQRFVDIIRKSGNRMLETVNDIIDISKIDAGQVELTKTAFNISEEVETIVEFFTGEARDNNLNLRVINKLPEHDAIILSDKVKVDSIMTNLIKNAIKYTSEGSIEISCYKEDSSMHFKISDSGIGIPTNRLTSIFNRFEQADIDDTQAKQGSGLGLSITKAYVEMLGGTINVESIEGQGSTFYFTIPWISSSDTTAGPIPENISYDLTAKKLKNVLVVEDDEVSFLHLQIILQDIVEKLHRAQSGYEAVNQMKVNPEMDLILMDIKLPKMNGYEATRLIREFNKDVVIIAQTAYALHGDEDIAITKGCDAYISKPINRDKLISLIVTSLRMKNLI